MSEYARFARQVGRALIVVVAVTVIVGIGSGAGAATGDQHPTDRVGSATADLDDPTDELNETTNETTDDLNDTTDELDETSEKLQRSTSPGDTVDTDNETIGIDGAVELDATVDGELAGDLNGTVLTSGDLSTALGVSANAGTDGASGPDSSATGSSDGAAGADSRTDGPGPGDAIDAALVGVLGGLALLGKGAATGGAGATGAGGSGSVLGRVGRYLPRLVGSLSSIVGKLPLSLLRYSRYDDSDPLEHETRRGIYEAIDADPGLYLSALEERLDVSLSTIRHHLSVLEDEGLLETQKQNGKRRYYPARAEDVELAAALDEPAKARVLDVLAETGDAHNGRIADALDLDPSTVSHHLSSLEDDGLIERRRDGRAIVNSLSPAVEAAIASRTDAADGPNGDATERILTYADD